MPKTWLLAFLLIFTSWLPASAQSLNGQPDWGGIESNISRNMFIGTAQKELQAIRQEAISTHNDIAFARSLNDLLRIQDRRTEDTLYFRNSAFIDTLLGNTATSQKLKAILYIMRAQRISKFDTHYKRFNFAAYRSKKLDPDYASLTVEQRDSVASKDLETALTMEIPGRDVDKLLWLASDPAVFLFTPTFKDLVYAEYINLANARRYYNEQPIGFLNWLSLPSPAFRSKLDSLAKQTKGTDKTLVGYQHWLSYQRSKEGKAAFIESLARKYIYLQAGADSVALQNYVAYLESGVASPYLEFKAHSVYQLCLIWNGEGKKYANFDRYYYGAGVNFDPRYQYYPAKALQLYEQQKNMLDHYPAFNSVLAAMAGQIKTRAVRIQIDDAHIPGEDIPIKVMYKNADTLYYRVIKTNVAAAPQKALVDATAGLLNITPVTQGVFALPLPADNNKHAVYLKLPALHTGKYRLLFSDQPLRVNGPAISNVDFTVTQIAAINTDKKIFVLDRKTGAPLAGARVRAFAKQKPVDNTNWNIVNKEGYVTADEGITDSVSISFNNDTAAYNFNADMHGYTDRDDEYNSAQYDNLADYYDSKARIEIFTDRSIYRPGQTVYFKMIMLTKNADTGEPIVLNKQNLAGAYTGLIKQWESAKDNLLTLTDPFRHKIDSARFTLNEFGSFAGQFVIPKTAATGNWNIDASQDNDYQNRGDFKVEEYKRPSIELTMLKQKKMLVPGKPFTITLKLRSFSGADLGHIPVAYKVTRTGYLPPSKKRPANYMTDYKAISIIDTTGYTNNKGELLISINDSALTRSQIASAEKLMVDYRLDAAAVDATGESAETNGNIDVSSRPVMIGLPVEPIYDRQALPAIKLTASNEFEGTLSRKINVRLYRVSDPTSVKAAAKEVDQWYYDPNKWAAWFPQKAPAKTAKVVKVLVADTIINTAKGGLFSFNKSRMTTGFYRLEATCIDSGYISGQHIADFKVFDTKTGETPGTDIDYLANTIIKPGDVVTWYTSGKTAGYSIYQTVYVSGSGKRSVKTVDETRSEKAGLRKWVFKVPQNAAEQIILSQISVANNKAVEKERRLTVIKPDAEQPGIIIERYRKVMAPGVAQTITLSVKTKNENVAAELLTTLYDAALDKLQPHNWDIPNLQRNSYYLYGHWRTAITTVNEAGKDFEQPYSYMSNGKTFDSPVLNQLQGRAAGISVSDAKGLNEVVVVGYGSQAKRDVTGSVSTVYVRGVSSLADYNQPLVVLDGVIVSGGISGIDPKSISAIAVLKGADASAIYGARAAQGVLIISTKGPIVLPGAVEEPVVKVRKDFNETAFFFPQVHAGADGYYTFSFTMPETATEWNWKMLAHTKNSQFAYAERKLQTQLSLMVQPNMPRLLYQGDKMMLRSRVSNLDTIAIKGRATCKIEDAVTGQDLTSQLTESAVQPFALDKKSTGPVAFTLHIPTGQSNPLKIVISVVSGSVADAEEHVLPVLSSKVFLRQSQAVVFGTQPSVTISPVKLPADAEVYGASLSIAQKPQASLLYALPFLANYSYDCAEQTFNKLRANATAIIIMRTDGNARSAYAAAKAGAANADVKESPIADELAEQSTPWLNIANKTAVQQKQLLQLLDTIAANAVISKHLDRLYKLQNPDGGLTWFDGGSSNAYISGYVLAGFAQLKQQGWRSNAARQNQHQQFIDRLFNYHATLLASLSAEKTTDQYQLYAMSYWLKDHSLPAISTQKVNSILAAAWQHIENQGLGQQALLIINTLRYTAAGNPLHKKAMQQLESIQQLAIHDATNGLRWKDIADAEDLNTSAEETTALITEAFEESGTFKEVNAGVVKWLLTIRQEQNWRTTKATAAAITMLQKDKGTAFGEATGMSASLGNRPLSVTDGLLKGSTFSFVPVKQLPPTVAVQQQGTNTRGALTWYYFAEPAGADTLNKSIKIDRQLFTGDKQRGWVALPQNTILKAGDKIQVKLTIETTVRLKFVHIADPRAAAFEPADNKSGYQYNNGFNYYRSVRDTGLDLFAESVPKGISTITYELVVAHDGDFTAGPATLQCMYNPSLTAYSRLVKIKTDK